MTFQEFLAKILALCLSIKFYNSRMKKIKKAIGERIYWIRKEKGITQVQLAELINSDTHTIGFIERGEVNTGFVNLYKICKALDIKMTYLFEGY